MSRKKIALERRQEIIAGLYKCLANAGHEKITIKDIAKASNLSYGVLHYYFRSKKDIMIALVEHFVKGMEDLLATHLNKSANAWERLRTFISVAVDRFVLDPEATMFFLNLYQMAFKDEEIRNRAKSSYSHYRGGVRTIVEDGIAQGEFAAIDPDQFAFAFVGMIEGMWLQVAMNPDLYSRETIESLLYESARLYLNPEGKGRRREGD